MTFQNRGNDRSRSTFYGKSSFGDKRSDRPAMHDAVCAKCGTACQVPFMPNGRKEVFCSKCFGEMNGDYRESRDSRGSGSSNFRDSRGPRMYDSRDNGSNFAERQMFSAVCDQCGDHCQVPFRPSNGKPVLCSNCFAGKNDERGMTSRVSSVSTADLATINTKLDKILKLLLPETPKEVAKEMTEKILEEIELNSGKSLVKPPKKAKKSK